MFGPPQPGRPGRVNKGAPVVEPLDLIPGPPAGLPELETRIWVELAAQFRPSRVVAASDMVAFEFLVRSAALADRVQADPKATTGQKVRASGAPLTALRNFRATPSSRGRVTKAPPPEAVSPLDECMNWNPARPFDESRRDAGHLLAYWRVAVQVNAQGLSSIYTPLTDPLPLAVRQRAPSERNSPLPTC